MKKRTFILFLAALSLFASEDTLTKAQTAISAKRFNEALTLYQGLLLDDPQNIGYLLWTARLASWTNDYKAATESYSKVLALNPQNTDALVGKANVLMWQKLFKDALPLLTEAQTLAPSDPDVELAWTRYYYFQGEEEQAKTHLKKVLDVDKSNQDALGLEKTLRWQHPVELRASYEADTLPGTDVGGIESLSLSYLFPKGQVGVDFAHLSRFGESGSRGGVHFSRRVADKTTIHAAILGGGGGDIVAKLDLSAGVSQKLQYGWVLGGDYRHISFPLVNVDAGSGSLAYYFEKPIWIESSLAANRTGSDVTPSFLLRFNSRLGKKLTVNVGYGHGTEVFQLSLPTQYGNFGEDDYLGGMEWAFSARHRLQGSFRVGRRSSGLLDNAFVLSWVSRL